MGYSVANCWQTDFLCLPQIMLVRARAEDCSQGLADHLYTRCTEYNKIYIVSWHILACELMGLRHLK